MHNIFYNNKKAILIFIQAIVIIIAIRIYFLVLLIKNIS